MICLEQGLRVTSELIVILAIICFLLFVEPIPLMIISIISVSISLLKKQNLRCGCLGTFFHIPLSYVTISENVAMLALSLKYS